MPVKKATAKKQTTEKVADAQKFNKQEIIYSAIVEKELLHNGIVQRETLKTLKDLSVAMRDMTTILQSFEQHQFLTMHQKKWKMVLYNLSMGMLFAIGTVMGLLLLSWSTYLFFRESPQIQNIINDQLKLRHFDLGEIQQQASEEWSMIPIISIPAIKTGTKETKTDSQVTIPKK